jgi:hypothetical protein
VRRSPMARLIVASIAVVLVGVTGAIAVFWGRTNDGPAHVCGLSIAQHSPVAIATLGSPIMQHGATMGHETWMTGGLLHRPRHLENDTFWVGGPKGSATVRAFSERTPYKSSLTVMLVADGSESSSILYDGPITCPEWHAADSK